MAEALLAKDHFYVNASYYNNTDTEQNAIITVQDNDDILRRDTGEEWLVHVTRFSCDSMLSLVYIKANAAATWEIIATDGAGLGHHAFNFTLDRDYATPRDLIADMNMRTRFMESGQTTAGTTYLECYRFEIDTGGRFRLTQPSPTSMQHSGWHITYSGSAEMNKILGFEQITPFINFTPDPAKQFCMALEYLEKECNKASSVQYVSDGLYTAGVNTVLVELLNGLEVKNQYAQNHPPGPGVEPKHGTEIDMTDSSWFSFLDNRNFLPGYKGLTVSAHNQHSGQALLPRSGVQVMCSYHTVPHGLDNRDMGPKVHNTRLIWSAPYTGAGGHDGVAGGTVTFQDSLNSNTDTSPAHFPIYHAGSDQWTNSKYVFPLDSIPGYWYSGTQVHGHSTSVAVDSYDTGTNTVRQFTLENPLPAFIKVGDDVWSKGQCQTAHIGEPGQLGYCQVHGIESITDDRLTVKVDWPFGTTTRADAFYANQDLVFTDRRIPYQTRSATFTGIHSWFHVEHAGTADLIDGVSQGIYTFDITPASAGDRLVFIELTEDAQEIAISYEIVNTDTDQHAIFVNGPFGIELNTISPADTMHANLAAKTFYIDKSGWDTLRWKQDTLRMKMAATTFIYQGVPQATLSRAEAHSVNGVRYRSTNYQTYDKLRLVHQVDKFHVAMRKCRVFADANLSFSTAVGRTERITDAILTAIPDQSEEGIGGTGIDFLAQDVRPVLTTNASDVLRPMGTGDRPASVIQRFTSPWFGIKMYSTDTWSAILNAERARINAFVKDNPDDKPILQFHVTTSSVGHFLHVLPFPNAIGHTVSPIITGVAPRADLYGDQEENFVIWAPEKNLNIQPIDDTSLHQSVSTVKNARFGIKYDTLTRAYGLCKKEHDELALSADSQARIYGTDGDYIASSVASQVDHIFPYRQLILTSNDLMQVPERSQDAASKQPILSSYTLPTLGSTSVDKTGDPSGGSSQPFGTIYFSEGGTRRFHHMIKVPGGLRRFRIQSALTYKDNSKPAEDMKLGPGGQFTCQLLFMKKEPRVEPTPAPVRNPAVFQ